MSDHRTQAHPPHKFVELRDHLSSKLSLIQAFTYGLSNQNNGVDQLSNTQISEGSECLTQCDNLLQEMEQEIRRNPNATSESSLPILQRNVNDCRRAFNAAVSKYQRSRLMNPKKSMTQDANPFNTAANDEAGRYTAMDNIALSKSSYGLQDALDVADSANEIGFGVSRNLRQQRDSLLYGSVVTRRANEHVVATQRLSRSLLFAVFSKKVMLILLILIVITLIILVALRRFSII